MEDKAIDAFTESPVAQGFDVAGMPAPPFLVAGGEGLGADDALAVNMRRRGHLRAGLQARRWARPELAHGLIGIGWRRQCRRMGLP